VQPLCERACERCSIYLRTIRSASLTSTASLTMQKLKVASDAAASIARTSLVQIRSSIGLTPTSRARNKRPCARRVALTAFSVMPPAWRSLKRFWKKCRRLGSVKMRPNPGAQACNRDRPAIGLLTAHLRECPMEVFSASLPVRALVVELSNLARGIPDHGSFGANMLLASPSLVFAAPQPFAPGLPGVRI